MHPARAPRVADDTTDEEAGAFLDSMRAPDGSVLGGSSLMVGPNLPAGRHG